MNKIKSIALPPGSPLRRPPHALLGYACLEDTYQIEGAWYTVADWRSWTHNEAVEAFRHAGVEQTGLRVGQMVAFYSAGSSPNETLVGYARVRQIRMTNAGSLTDREIAALDYSEEEYEEFLNFENEAGWYVTLERVEIA